MLSEISIGRRVKPPSERDLLPHTLQGITQKYALFLGQCNLRKNNDLYISFVGYTNIEFIF